MTLFFLIAAIVIALLMLFALYRVIKGPTLFDRIVATGLMGTNGVLMLALFGFIYQRVDMFLDLAIAYALLNFVATVAIGKYLARKRQESK